MNRNFVKTETGLVVNTNTDEYTKYMAQKKNANRLSEMEIELNNIKKDMSDIKNLLQLLVNKG